MYAEHFRNQSVTSFKLCNKQKSKIKHLRIIGSNCNDHVPNQKAKKMDMKVGYLVGNDGDERCGIYVRNISNINFMTQ